MDHSAGEDYFFPGESASSKGGATAVCGGVGGTTLRGKGLLLPKGVGLFHLYLGLCSAVLRKNGAAAVRGGVGGLSPL